MPFFSPKQKKDKKEEKAATNNVVVGHYAFPYGSAEYTPSPPRADDHEHNLSGGGGGGHSAALPADDDEQHDSLPPDFQYQSPPRQHPTSNDATVGPDAIQAVLLVLPHIERSTAVTALNCCGGNAKHAVNLILSQEERFAKGNNSGNGGMDGKLLPPPTSRPPPALQRTASIGHIGGPSSPHPAPPASRPAVPPPHRPQSASSTNQQVSPSGAAGQPQPSFASPNVRPHHTMFSVPDMVAILQLEFPFHTVKQILDCSAEAKGNIVEARSALTMTEAPLCRENSVHELGRSHEGSMNATSNNNMAAMNLQETRHEDAPVASAPAPAGAAYMVADEDAVAADTSSSSVPLSVLSGFSTASTSSKRNESSLPSSTWSSPSYGASVGVSAQRAVVGGSSLIDRV